MLIRSLSFRLSAGLLSLCVVASSATALPTDPRVEIQPVHGGPPTARAILTGEPGGVWVLETSVDGATLSTTGGVLDADGVAVHDLVVPAELLEATLGFEGLFLDPGGATTVPVTFPCSALLCEPLSFDYDRQGPIGPGELLADRWTDSGMSIVVRRRTPVLSFDSNAPTGDDPDLVTPGSGLLNTVAYDNLLVLGQEGTPLGDLLADPDANAGGGRVAFTWENDVQTCAITLVDVDEGFGARIRRYLDGELVDEVEIRPWPDNNVRTFPLEPLYVDQMVVRFAGNGGIARLDYLPCPRLADFDLSTTGIPFEVLEGELCTDQFLSQDFTVSATNADPTHPDEAILLDRGAEGIVVAIARDDVDGDGDGLIDDPEIEPAGGTITFDWALCTRVEGARLVELENEATVRVYDQDDVLLYEGMTTNGATDFGGGVELVRRVEFVLQGLGAIGGLRYCPTPGADL